MARSWAEAHAAYRSAPEIFLGKFLSTTVKSQCELTEHFLKTARRTFIRASVVAGWPTSMILSNLKTTQPQIFQIFSKVREIEMISIFLIFSSHLPIFYVRDIELISIFWFFLPIFRFLRLRYWTDFEFLIFLPTVRFFYVRDIELISNF